jgi:hypothetical protein
MTCATSPVRLHVMKVLSVPYNNVLVLYSETRADLLMASFNLNGPNDENVKANIRDKIFAIAGFMGVSMEEEFREEYDSWEMEKDMGKLAIASEKQQIIGME